MTIKIKFADAKAIEAAIVSIQRRGAKLDSDIQDAGMSVLSHIDKHNDVTLLCRLFNSMPKGSRRNALAEWAVKYGKVSVNMDKSSNKELPFLYAKGSKTNLEGADAEKWYQCKPEKDVDEEFDFEGKLNALIKMAQAKQAAGKPVKGAERLAALTAANTEPKADAA